MISTCSVISYNTNISTFDGILYFSFLVNIFLKNLISLNYSFDFVYVCFVVIHIFAGIYKKKIVRVFRKWDIIEINIA